jgi:hypothetical protein
VPGPDALLLPESALPPVLMLVGGILAYGPAPGVELIPYFLGLLAWLGVALVAILRSPISALVRRLRSARGAPPAQPKNELMTMPAPESPAPMDPHEH